MSVAPVIVHVIAGTVQLAVIAVTSLWVMKYPAQLVEVAFEANADFK